MTNTIPNVPRELLADLLGNDHDKRIMAERHLLAMLANAPSPAGEDGLEVVGHIDSDDDVSGSYAVFKNDCDLRDGTELVRLSDAQTIIDGLRGEVGAQRVKTCTALKERNDAREERDQQAQRIGELEGLLRSCLPALSDGGCAALANRIDAALSAVCGAAPNIATTSEHSSQPERAKVTELVELVRSKFPRIDPCQPVPLDEKAHCCEYTIYVERERLHRLIDAKLASLGVINLDYLPDDVVANAQNVRGYLIPSVDLTPLQLSLRYPDGHPNFTVKMWQSHPMNCTSSGYWDWVQLKLRYES